MGRGKYIDCDANGNTAGYLGELLIKFGHDFVRNRGVENATEKVC